MKKPKLHVQQGAQRCLPWWCAPALLAALGAVSPLTVQAAEPEVARMGSQPVESAAESAPGKDTCAGTEELPRHLPGRSDAEHPHFPKSIYESLPPVESSASDFVAVPDRWRMFYAGKWYDPYNQNVLKGDIPVFGAPGHEWFVEATLISDTLTEQRRLPQPVGGASTNRPGSTDTFGGGDQTAFVENVIASLSLIRGNTTFKPPELELRIAPIFNLNRVVADENGVLKADPAYGNTRTDSAFGFQELFADVHLANLSDRYDFVSSRVGIQQFNADFRGFLFNDNEPGARIFGNYDDNKVQFNLAYFSRLDKDTNSGINTFRDRHEDIFLANVYRQDLLALGHAVSMSVVHREDRAGEEGLRYDDNNFLVRPTAIGDQRSKNIYSTYLGVGGDGHLGRINTTTQYYYAFGSESHNQLAQRQVSIQAQMFAQELSYDVDWVRFRTSFFWASGDKDPYDGTAGGFDAIFDNPNFAGGDLSFWQRQGIPFIGGGGTNLTNRNSLLPNFRPGKELGQSNFVNPGLRLYNVGVDFELTPTLKLITNASYLQFDQVGPLEVARQDGSISSNIGVDLSAGFLYRPFLNNNVQIRVGSGCLLPAAGYKNLFGDAINFDLFSNVILQY